MAWKWCEACGVLPRLAIFCDWIIKNRKLYECIKEDSPKMVLVYILYYQEEKSDTTVLLTKKIAKYMHNNKKADRDGVRAFSNYTESEKRKESPFHFLQSRISLIPIGPNPGWLYFSFVHGAASQDWDLQTLTRGIQHNCCRSFLTVFRVRDTWCLRMETDFPWKRWMNRRKLVCFRRLRFRCNVSDRFTWSQIYQMNNLLHNCMHCGFLSQRYGG